MLYVRCARCGHEFFTRQRPDEYGRIRCSKCHAPFRPREAKVEEVALLEELESRVVRAVERAVEREVKKAVEDALNPVREEVAKRVEELVSASLCSLKEDLTTMKIAYERNRRFIDDFVIYLGGVKKDLESFMEELKSFMEELRRRSWRRY